MVERALSMREVPRSILGDSIAFRTPKRIFFLGERLSLTSRRSGTSAR